LRLGVSFGGLVSMCYSPSFGCYSWGLFTITKIRKAAGGGGAGEVSQVRPSCIRVAVYTQSRVTQNRGADFVSKCLIIQGFTVTGSDKC
jgi:hypothetical protein